MHSQAEIHISNSTYFTLAKLGIVHIQLGAWEVFLNNAVDFYLGENEPMIGMAFLLQRQTGHFVSRVLHRKYVEGYVLSEDELSEKCQQFFVEMYPCLGMGLANVEKFPQGLRFAPDCAQIFSSSQTPDFPKFKCQKCTKPTADAMAIDTVARDFHDQVTDVRIQTDLVDEVTLATIESDGGSSEQSVKPNDGRRRSQRLQKLPDVRPGEAECTMVAETNETDIPTPQKQSTEGGKLRHGRQDVFVVDVNGTQVTIDNSVRSGSSLWQCELCSQSMLFQNRRHHLRKSHQLLKMDCPKCPKSFLCPLIMVDHITQVHGHDQPAQCVICKSMVDVKTARDSLQLHIRSCLETRRTLGLQQQASYNSKRAKIAYMCHSCGQSCKSNKHLLTHIQHAHEMKSNNWTCTECHKIMSIHRRQSHLRNIHHYGRFQCSTCFQVYRRSSELANHVLLVHPSVQTAPCPECKAEFAIADGDINTYVSHHKQCLSRILSQRRKAATHRIKSRPLLHPCHVCPKSFPTQYLLNAHKRTHKSSSYFCDQCAYRTHSNELFQDHTKIHATTTDCCLCAESFDSKEMLHKHLKSEHEDGFTAPCVHCGAVFKNMTLLRSHLHREHDDQTGSFHCSHCSFRGNTRESFDSHHRIAHENVALACDICLQTVESREALKAHLRSTHHRQEVTYQCNHCENLFKNKSGLYSHMSAEHKLRLPKATTRTEARLEPETQYLLNPEVGFQIEIPSTTLDLFHLS